MNLKELRNEIPFHYRQWPGGKKLAYIDARDVQNTLDDVCSAENWKVSYKTVWDNLFCTISILVGDRWISKSDCGTESKIEKEKWEASDSFKRAGVMWWIGRFLYSLPDWAKSKPYFRDASKLQWLIDEWKKTYKDTDEVTIEILKAYCIDSESKDIISKIRLWEKQN